MYNSRENAKEMKNMFFRTSELSPLEASDCLFPSLVDALLSAFKASTVAAAANTPTATTRDLLGGIVLHFPYSLHSLHLFLLLLLLLPPRWQLAVICTSMVFAHLYRRGVMEITGHRRGGWGQKCPRGPNQKCHHPSHDSHHSGICYR